jgi:LAO/AO transport system kinase
MDETVRRLLEGDHRAVSQLISIIERGGQKAADVMAHAYPHTGRAYCVGITGPPGVGKSTIVDRLTETIRGEGLSVGIIAVDPTSPYSGGAFLGDRIRMQRHYLDPGVFIRSVASRESPGGLPRVVQRAARLLDAAGKDVVLVETVGVGQTELGVMGVADTVVVAIMPESGDVIQTLKAGLMEIADIYVVNKADREGANQMMTAITSMLRMAASHGDWIPPVMAAQAHVNEGVEGIYRSIQQHREFLASNSRLDRRRGEQRGREFMDTVESELSRRLRDLMAEDDTLRNILEGVERGELEPYSSAMKLLGGDLGLLRGLASFPHQ